MLILQRRLKACLEYSELQDIQRLWTATNRGMLPQPTQPSTDEYSQQCELK